MFKRRVLSFSLMLQNILNVFWSCLGKIRVDKAKEDEPRHFSWQKLVLQNSPVRITYVIKNKQVNRLGGKNYSHCHVFMKIKSAKRRRNKVVFKIV